MITRRSFNKSALLAGLACLLPVPIVPVVPVVPATAIYENEVLSAKELNDEFDRLLLVPDNIT